MKELKDFMLSVFGICISVSTMVLVMIYGWGLQPKSWFWIIGAYFIGNILAVLIHLIAKESD